MKSSVVVLTALAVIGFSGAALAGQAKPAAMSDAEMDKVTAGAANPYAGSGVGTGLNDQSWHASLSGQEHGNGRANNPDNPK